MPSPSEGKLRINYPDDSVWDITLGGEDYDRACGVEALHDGYLIAGTSSSFGLENCIYIAGIDRHGGLLWNRTYEAGWYGCYATDIARAEDGFIIAGVASGNVHLLRIDDQADLVWNTTYPSTRQDVAEDVLPCDDGGFLVTGESQGDVYVLKVDAGRNKVWDNRFGTTHMDHGYSAAQDGKGGFVVVGETLVSSDGLHYEMFLISGARSSRRDLLEQDREEGIRLPWL